MRLNALNQSTQRRYKTRETAMRRLSEELLIAGQITADDFETAKQHGITMIINNRPDGEEPGIMPVAEAQQLAKQHGITYLHLPMKNEFPLPDDLIPNMQNALESQAEKGELTLAHCRTGTRSSFLWSVIQIINGKKGAIEVINDAADAGINLNNFALYLQQLELDCIQH